LPASAGAFITKDEMADYLASYAAHFELPIRTGHRVDLLWQHDERFRLDVGGRLYEADNVIVAIGNYQRPKTPEFSSELAPHIKQLHSNDYCNPDQLAPGDVLVVGAGNSGAEIAIELVRTRRTLISGKEPGSIPFDIDGFAARLFLRRLVLRGLFHRVLTLGTPVGRAMRATFIERGTPLIRVKPRDLVAAGVERVPRTVGVRDGLPLLEDGRALDVSNVIWCTGYELGLSWIDLPIHGDHEPLHDRGFVPSQPGLFFVGLEFQYAASSGMVQGVGRDARRVCGAVVDRVRAMRSTSTAARADVGAAVVGSAAAMD
jgi:putative flavoprotein involved in K+ transport